MTTEKGAYYVVVRIGQLVHYLNEEGGVEHTVFSPLVEQMQIISAVGLYNDLLDKDEKVIRLVADLVAEALRNADTTGVVRDK